MCIYSCRWCSTFWTFLLLLAFLFPKSSSPKLCPDLTQVNRLLDKYLSSTTNVLGTVYLRAFIICRLGCPTNTINSEPPLLSLSLLSTTLPPLAPMTVTAAISHPEAQAKHQGSMLASPLSLHPTPNQQSSPGKNSFNSFYIFHFCPSILVQASFHPSPKLQQPPLNWSPRLLSSPLFSSVLYIVPDQAIHSQQIITGLGVQGYQQHFTDRKTRLWKSDHLLKW